MKTSVQIIEEIKADARDLQQKFLTLPGAGSCDANQLKAIGHAMEGLSSWRTTQLALLAKAFEKRKTDGGTNP